ncbi:MAG: diguanylate cyclase domain-containing protein [Pyrinomonadaceae bacterium]
MNQIYLLVIITGIALITAYLFKPPRFSSMYYLAATGICVLLWTCGELIAISTIDYSGKLFGEVVRFSGVLGLPICLLCFVRRFTGKDVSAKTIVLLSIVPIISFMVLVTNSSHGLFFKQTNLDFQNLALNLEYGQFFWYVHTPYSYTIILTSVLLLILELFKVSKRFRSEVLLMLIAVCVPVAINVLSLLGLSVGFNLNPLAMFAFLAIAGLGISRMNTLRKNPIAYETVFNTSHDGIIVIDNQFNTMDINRAAMRGLNMKKDDLIGVNINEIFSNWAPYADVYGEDKISELNEIEIELRGKTQYFSVNLLPVYNRDQEAIGSILTIRNETNQRTNALALEAMAFHDPLTMLANRRKFESEFETAIEVAVTSKKQFAILYFDLNSFKSVNDSHGHKAGDELLKYVGARIASILRKPDVVARLGGDEFAAILHNANPGGVKIAVERIIENTRKPFRIKDETIVAKLSIGAAFFPYNGETLGELLIHADKAMYRAKADGGGLAFYDSRIDTPFVVNH